MELIVRKADLVKELAAGQGVVEKKTTIPVLSNVLVEAQDGEIALTVTDLELGIRSKCAADVKKPGATTIPARKLLDYVRLLPDAELSLKVNESHSVNLVCGRSKSRIAGMSRENFPELAEMPAPITGIPASVVTNVIGKTIFAIAHEESRYTLTGALMLIKEESMVMVATDGHRLAYIQAPNHFEGVSGQVKVLVPKKALTEIQKLAAETGGSMSISFAADDNHLFFQCGDRLLITRKLTGQFPDYERVLPKDLDRHVLVGREELQAAIRRVAQFADDRSHAVRLELAPGELKLVSSGSDAGEGEEVLPVDYSGEKMKIGFNAQYLLDFLGVSETSEVELALRDEESAGEMRMPSNEGCEYRYVIMPMRI